MDNDPAPTFSIVVPVYNKEPHIARALDSCLGQTYRDFELLVINDASTDNSLGEITRFDDTRIRILERSTPGPGGYAARNLGIKNAKGKWIAFLDADDEWVPSYLNDLFELAKTFPDCDFLTCGWTTLAADGSSREDKYYLMNMPRGAHTLSFFDYLTACVNGMRPTNSSVACIRNNEISKDLFPDGRQGRGGDLHAWLSYLARSKDMAWSPTIGGTYYQNTVNQVTKSTPYSADLALAVVDEIKPYLNPAEMKMLKKYSNRRIYSIWKGQNHNDEEPLKLASSLQWSDDLPFCLTRTAISLVPFKLLTRFSQLWRSLVSA
jgi:glycosyltransferase involved in cell wall biosynthesis